MGVRERDGITRGGSKLPPPPLPRSLRILLTCELGGTSVRIVTSDALASAFTRPPARKRYAAAVGDPYPAELALRYTRTPVS